MNEELTEKDLNEKFGEEFMNEIDSAIEDDKEDVSGDFEEKNELEEKPEENLEEDLEEKGELEEGQEEEELEENKGEKPEETPLDDAMVERGIKVGLPFSEIKELHKAGLLDNLVSRMETQSQSGGNDGSQDDADDSNELDEIVNSMPDLDPEEYDEALVQMQKANKETVKTLIDALKSRDQEIEGLKSSRNDGWFDSKVSSLDKGVVAKLDKTPQMRADLQDKFNMLSAGYQSLGKQVSQDAVFKEASQLVLGDLMKEAGTEKVKSKLQKRKAQHTQRPNNSRGKKSKNPEAEVAASIDAQYFK